MDKINFGSPKNFEIFFENLYEKERGWKTRLDEKLAKKTGMKLSTIKRYRSTWFSGKKSQIVEIELLEKLFSIVKLGILEYPDFPKGTIDQLTKSHSILGKWDLFNYRENTFNHHILCVWNYTNEPEPQSFHCSLRLKTSKYDNGVIKKSSNPMFFTGKANIFLNHVAFEFKRLQGLMDKEYYICPEKSIIPGYLNRIFGLVLATSHTEKHRARIWMAKKNSQNITYDTENDFLAVENEFKEVLKLYKYDDKKGILNFLQNVSL